VGQTRLTVVDALTELNIDGHRPAAIATPESAAELASILARSAVDGATVVPFGGATALGLGNVPERVDLALATGGLARVLAYEPADLTLSVEAGASVAAIQALLAEHGQELPIDVPFPDRATIGGVIATGFAGPRRLRDGTLRDVLIGASFARADGTVVKSGGLVVKNVSGFDLARLMHGALGTLGVLTSVNLKVLPAARTECTLLVDSDDDVQRLTDAAVAACQLPVRPTALELLLESASSRLALRLRGRAQGVEEQARELRSLLNEHRLSVTEEKRDAESGAWWQETVDHWGKERPDVAQFVLRARPRNVAQGIERLRLVITDRAPSAEAICSPGLGLARMNLPIPAAESGEWLRSRQAEWLRAVDDVVVQFAPPGAKRGLDVWGREASGLPVMRDLKRELDPSGALNRGRFMGFI
jgi:glycolate oxidase FAD binding subunit